MVGISKSAVHRILSENLDMRKLYNKADFLRRFVTMDEIWVHHFGPETKEQSKQWTERGESAPKKVKTVPSAGKVMASVFWDARGTVFIFIFKQDIELIESRWEKGNELKGF